MLAFTTRRDEEAPGRFRTHDWVVHELLLAQSLQPQIPVVEIREDGVITPGGMIEAANRQRIEYGETRQVECLVRIAEALRLLRERTAITTIRLGPLEALDEIRPYKNDAGLNCTYQTLTGTVESAPQPAKVIPVQGGLCLMPRGIPSRSMVRVAVSVRGRTWTSDYQSVDTIDVGLKEE